MKKLIVIFNLIWLLFVSCNKNEDNYVKQQDVVLLKKAISTAGNSSITMTYSYQGNKLVRIDASTGSYILHTYEGDLITKVAQFSNSQIVSESFNQYDSTQKLTSTKSLNYQDSSGTITNYVYNNDGTVNYQIYSGSLSVQNNLSGTGKIWVNLEGEVIKMEEYNGSNSLISKKEISYDSGFSVFKNVAGFAKLFEINVGKKFNISNYKVYNSNNQITGGYSNSSTYDSNNFPVLITSTQNSGSISNIQYFY